MSDEALQPHPQALTSNTACQDCLGTQELLPGGVLLLQKRLAQYLC